MAVRSSRSLRAATSRLARAGHLPDVLAGTMALLLTRDPFAGRPLVVDPVLVAALAGAVEERPQPVPDGDTFGEDRQALSRRRSVHRPGSRSRTDAPVTSLGSPAPHAVDRWPGIPQSRPSTFPAMGQGTLLPDRNGESGTEVREAGAGPSRLARHGCALVEASGRRWPVAGRLTDCIAADDVPVRVVRDDELGARLRAIAGGRSVLAATAAPHVAPMTVPTPATQRVPPPAAVAPPSTRAAGEIGGFAAIGGEPPPPAARRLWPRAGGPLEATAPTATSTTLRNPAAQSTRPDGLASLVEWWDESGGSAAASPISSIPAASSDSEHRFARHAPQTVLRIEQSDALVDFRDALEQVLLDEALADGLAVT